MGRFFAPPVVDHQQEEDNDNGDGGGNTSEPMDWTLISDHDENDDIGEDDDDNVMMLDRMQLNDNDIVAEEEDRSYPHTSSAMIVATSADVDNDNNNNNNHATDNNVHTRSDDDNGNNGNASNATISHNNNNATLLLQQCLQQLQLSNEHQLLQNHQHSNEQQRRQRRRNKLVWFTILLFISIIGIVLKWFAPPPPPLPSPLLMFGREPTTTTSSSYSTLTTSTLDLNNGNNVNSNRMTKNNNEIEHTKNIQQQHKQQQHHHHNRIATSWNEYLHHILQITTTAIQYLLHEVIWYSISYSFMYAFYDLMYWLRNNEIFSVSGGSCRSWNWLSSWWRSDGDNQNHNHHKKKITIQLDAETISMGTCPIRIQAAWNHHTLLPRGVSSYSSSSSSSSLLASNDKDYAMMEGLATEESLRQYIIMSASSSSVVPSSSSSSLPKSQTLAVQSIAQGIDLWGDELVQGADVSVVHRMAMMMRMGLSLNNGNMSQQQQQHDDDTIDSGSGDRDNDKKKNASSQLEWLLPPAKGFLFIGPAGVGKLHIARHVANWFFAHCRRGSDDDNNDDVDSSSCSNDGEVDSILQILTPGEEMEDPTTTTSITTRRRIVQHLQRRNGLGSVIIIHHIENLDGSLLSDIVNVLNGNADTIPYHDADENFANSGKNDNEKVVSTDGTVFLLTSEQLGTKRLFQMIQRNNGLGNNKALMNEGLISGIRWEVESYLKMTTNKYYWQQQRLSSQSMTIVPFLPFQEEDMLLVMESKFRELSDMYQDVHWVRLDVSASALSLFVGMDQMDYLDLYPNGSFQPTKARDDNEEVGDENEVDESTSDHPLITFSTNGAHALQDSFLYTTMKTKLISGTRRRPYKVALLGTDDDNLVCILSWCDPDYDEVKTQCEEEWRLPI